jgi:hypothetical protein
MKMLRTCSMVVGAFVLAMVFLSGSGDASVSFLAVAAGDATTSDAILWTRAQDSSTTAGVSGAKST